MFSSQTNMKKLIIIPLLIVAIGAFGQATYVLSKAVANDHFWLPKGNVEVTPIPIPDGTDTVRSIFRVIPIVSDTTQVVYGEIKFFNRGGNYMSSTFLPVTGTLFNHAADVAILAKMDTYINTKRSRIVLWP